MAVSSKTKEGDYRAITGEIIRSSSSEYEVLDFLGKGTFGQVRQMSFTFSSASNFTALFFFAS
jgi:hypothetical protein